MNNSAITMRTVYILASILIGVFSQNIVYSQEMNVVSYDTTSLSSDYLINLKLSINSPDSTIVEFSHYQIVENDTSIVFYKSMDANEIELSEFYSYSLDGSNSIHSFQFGPFSTSMYFTILRLIRNNVIIEEYILE